MKKPIWVSHRGLHTNATENSKDAFTLALKAGFDQLETDLRLSADGEIFLAHDDSLLRVSGQNLLVTQTKAAALRNVRLNDGQSLLGFHEFFACFRHVPWVFDIKPEAGERTIHALHDWATDAKAEDFISANTRFLLWKQTQKNLVKNLFPSARFMAMERQCYLAGFATMCRLPALGMIQPGLTYAIPPAFMGKNLYEKTFIQAYQNRGASTIAYLPQTPEQFARAIDAGVDEILSDGYIKRP